MSIRWKAQHPSGSREYFTEPYTVQHFTDFVADVTKLWCWEFPVFVFRHFTSKRFRTEVARQYNDAIFGMVPTDQIYDLGKGRTLRPEERNWPETRRRLYPTPAEIAARKEEQEAMDAKMREEYGPNVVSVSELGWVIGKYPAVLVEYRDGRVEERPYVF